MDEGQKIVITGATGTIGREVVKRCLAQGYAVTVLTRDPDRARGVVPGAGAYLPWRVETPRPDMPWVQAIDGVYAVINLAGESLFEGRYNKERARQAQATRENSTRALVQAMEMTQKRPAVFINSSSQGYYGFTDGLTNTPVTEETPPGRDDWAEGNVNWEAEAAPARALGIRIVLMRTSYVLEPGPTSGLSQQVNQYRKGQGGIPTPADAWVSWIHIDDEARLYLTPVGKREYARLLGEATIGKPLTRTMPGALLKLMMGKVAEIWMYGKPVVPRKAEALGFEFPYPTLESALADLVPQIA